MINMISSITASKSFSFKEHPRRTIPIFLFAIAIIIFSLGLALGVVGLASNTNTLPDWLKNTVVALKTKGLIGVMAVSYVGSAILAEYAGPIHSKSVLANEWKALRKTKIDRMFLTATRVPRAILSTAIDVALLPLAALLLLIASFRSNFDSQNPKRGKIPILQIHGSGFNEIEWAASWPWLSKKAYGSVFTLNLDGLASNEHHMGIDDYARGKIRDKIREILALTGMNEIILVGHSMGGLAAAFYAENCAELDGIKVRHVFTIASPWHGAPILNCQSENTKPKRYVQMTENSEFLKSLVQTALQSENAGMRNYYSMGTTMDFMVPGGSSLLSGKRERSRLFFWLGHYGVIAYPATWVQMRKWLDPIYKIGK